MLRAKKNLFQDEKRSSPHLICPLRAGISTCVPWGTRLLWLRRACPSTTLDKVSSSLSATLLFTPILRESHTSQKFSVEIPCPAPRQQAPRRPTSPSFPRKHALAEAGAGIHADGIRRWQPLLPPASSLPPASVTPIPLRHSRESGNPSPHRPAANPSSTPPVLWGRRSFRRRPGPASDRPRRR